MGVMRSRYAAILQKIEAVEGVFESGISASTDGVLVENPQLQFESQNTETNEVTGSLDPNAPIVGGLKARLSGKIYLKGSGVPGVAPNWGTLLRTCGWGETITKTDIGPVTTISVTGTNTFADSANGLAGATFGTVIFVSGFADPANNGEFRVTSSAAGALGVIKTDGGAPGLVNVAAGASVTIRYGVGGNDGLSTSTSTVFRRAGGGPWVSTPQIYRGMPAQFTLAWGFIADYDGIAATLVDIYSPALGTSTKGSILANVLYKPISTGIPSGSVEFYMDGIRYQLAGCRGEANLELNAGGACAINFTLSGMLVGKTDTAVPSPVYDSTRPGAFRNSKFTIDRVAAAIAQMTLGTNAQIEYPEDPNQAEGFGPPAFLGRRLVGQMDPLGSLVATRDLLAQFRAGGKSIVHARLLGGQYANPGNRIGITIPAAIHDDYQPTDRNGLATESVRFFASGQDAGAFIAVY